MLSIDEHTGAVCIYSKGLLYISYLFSIFYPNHWTLTHIKWYASIIYLLHLQINSIVVPLLRTHTCVLITVDDGGTVLYLICYNTVSLSNLLLYCAKYVKWLWNCVSSFQTFNMIILLKPHILWISHVVLYTAVDFTRKNGLSKLYYDNTVCLKIPFQRQCN